MDLTSIFLWALTQIMQLSLIECAGTVYIKQLLNFVLRVMIITPPLLGEEGPDCRRL